MKSGDVPVWFDRNDWKRNLNKKKKWETKVTEIWILSFSSAFKMNLMSYWMLDKKIDMLGIDRSFWIPLNL